MRRAWIVRPGRRHLATPSRPVVAASLESQSAAGGGPRRTTPRLPHFGGKYEDDPLSGVVTGTRALRPCGCAGEGRPSRDVEVRVPDWRAEADVHTDDQDGRGQARRDDELARPEGDESQGRETEGCRSDLLRRAGAWG